MKRPLPVLLSFVLLSGCSRDPERIKLEGEPGAIKAEILKLMPVGSSVAEAEKVMEADDFGCRMKLNGKFSESLSVSPQEFRLHEGKDFLYCTKTVRDEKWSLWSLEREWAIAIVQRDGVVEDVFVATWVMAPFVGI
jgi:hypothetical protein